MMSENTTIYHPMKQSIDEVDNMTIVRCSECSNIFEKFSSNFLRSKNNFCSRNCWISWMNSKNNPKRRRKTKICPICNAEIMNNHLTLIFGPESFRQKASFDGVDCLRYFLEKLELDKRKQEAPMPEYEE